MKRYEQTDDPADPCPYDVQWMTPEGDNVESMEDAVRALPFIGPGKVAPRVYRYTHDECEKAVMQYVAESAL